MASITLKRASWCLQISRTSRTFEVSFSTALPRRAKSRHPAQQNTAPFHEFSTARPSPRDTTSRSSRHAEARRAFSNTKVYRAQQSSQRSQTAASPLEPQPTQPTETILPDAESFSGGLSDQNIVLDEAGGQVDWSTSFHGLSAEAFSPEAAKALLAPIDPEDIEVKPDGIVYLPEIKYRRILNEAFGPGGWGLAPRGKTIVTPKSVTREYALVALGRLVSVARGEQDYFSPEGIPTAVEGCKSSALRRCCKDLGIASELWDPRYLRKFNMKFVKEVWVEHQATKKKRKIYLRKDEDVKYPFKEVKFNS